MVASFVRSAVAVGLTLVGVGCVDERSGISASASFAPPLELSTLTVTFREAGREWRAYGSGFTTDASNGTPHSAEWGTGTSGRMDVSFEMVDSAGTTVAAGQITLELRPDWRWGVHFANATTDPRQQCFGCSGSRAFPLVVGYRAPDRDSLWVVWGGNSIDHPVMY
jgi:hypothetical protein